MIRAGYRVRRQKFVSLLSMVLMVATEPLLAERASLYLRMMLPPV
jgi:hypothetical protein